MMSRRALLLGTAALPVAAVAAPLLPVPGFPPALDVEGWFLVVTDTALMPPGATIVMTKIAPLYWVAVRDDDPDFTTENLRSAACARRHVEGLKFLGMYGSRGC